MEIVILVGILFLVWYYGASIKDALERSDQIAINVGERITTRDGSIDALENQLSRIGDSLNDIACKIDNIGNSVKVDWEFAEKHTFLPMLDKLDQISALSVDLDAISNEMSSISGAVHAIAAHPAFTQLPDDHI